jgi:hypothetical protein
LTSAGTAAAADPIELGLAQPVEQELEVRIGLAREADDEGRADGEIGADAAPAPDARQGLLLGGRPLHAPEHIGARMLERHVEIGERLAFGQERNDLVHMRIGIDVMQPDPDPELAERAGQRDEPGRDLAAFPRARRVFEIDPIGGGVLRDDQELLDARRHQALGFAKHVGGRPGDQVAAQPGDDAERAAVVTTL